MKQETTNLLAKTIETAETLADVMGIDKMEAVKFILAYEQNRIIESQLIELNRTLRDGMKNIIDTHQSILFN